MGKTARWRCDAPAVSSNGIVYIGGSSRTFYAIDAASGAVKWKLHEFQPLCGGTDSGHFFLRDRLREQCEANHELGYQLMKRIAEVVVQNLNATQQRLLE